MVAELDVQHMANIAANALFGFFTANISAFFFALEGFSSLRPESSGRSSIAPSGISVSQPTTAPPSAW